MMNAIALSLVRSQTIHVSGTGMHPPRSDCFIGCFPYWRALPGSSVDQDEFHEVLTVVACDLNDETRHSRAFVGSAVLDICAHCTVAAFYPLSKTLHVLAWSREDELALVERVGAALWTPFTDSDARNMLRDTRSRLTVALDDSDEAFESITPAMMRLVIAGRLQFVLSERS
jgi:hypothetical protein